MYTNTQVHLIISGKVQGVFYRATTLEVARNLNLTGWVRNLHTGEVEVLVQGEKEKVEKLIDWCKKGPPKSDVTEVEIKWEESVEKYSEFLIR